MSAVHNRWRHIPSGIPKDPELRKLKLVQIRADVARPVTPEVEAEDRMRIAQKVAEIHGVSGLFRK
jgi:hypothetical protein